MISALPKINPRPGNKYAQNDRVRAWRLRNECKLSWAQIAELMGIPQGTAHYLATGSAAQKFKKGAK